MPALTPRVNSYQGDMDKISIKGPTIRLGQLLKLANVIDQGADAKAVLVDGAVRVNGSVETRRGRQLVSGDVVELADVAVVVDVAATPERGRDDS